MARNSSVRKPKQERSDDPQLLAHIASLGLKAIDDYIAWCEQHGFSRRTAKHWRERLRERAFATRAAADARLARKKDETRRPEKIIESIFRGDLRLDDITQPHLRLVCQARENAKRCGSTARSFRRLLLHVCTQTDLLDQRPVIAEYGWEAGNTFIEALLALARHATGWLRPPEDWKPRTHNARRQFASLARHLFAWYPVPDFMDSVWFKDEEQPQRWFRHLGRGENIRTADLPLPYTKRMAHHFMQAPAELSVEAALRWGQIHALGGDARLVQAVTATRLGRHFEQDDFWINVLRFLIANPMLDRHQVGPIVDYIYHQKFVPQADTQGPAQPNFTTKGRTPASLLRQVDEWHRTLARTEQPKAEWQPSGFGAFEFVEGSEQNGTLKVWTIRELLSTKALFAEGRAMKHCVATYAQSCARRVCSIWTLEVETFEGRRKVLTVEVNNSARLICQARGKCNAMAAEKHRQILRRWAEQERLTLASYA